MRFESSAFSDEESPDINVIPLIDVLLVLLIFFILSTTFDQSRGIAIKLPKAQSATPEMGEKDFSLLIDSNKNVFLEGKKIPSESIERELSAAASSNKIKSVVIRADENVSHGFVVHIMDEAKKAGAEKLSLAVNQ